MKKHKTRKKKARGLQTMSMLKLRGRVMKQKDKCSEGGCVKKKNLN